ncbi:MBL fold metallo-hydrolase [Lentibacillus sp. L22]|uniref:MBL fold metallo-hydrolase n=1 Tax=Lentibacillus TaxID=175304 RepID=UPI0022B1B845|nr:MBL fold metallo-hydrolase [Lentibacillus daqui]
MPKQTCYTDQVTNDILKPFKLKQITLDLPFRLDHVNCFLAEGENGWIVIDAGLHNQETVLKWDKELKQKTVTDIIITHYHPDHFGYAGGLQEKTGAHVLMTKTDYDAGLKAWTDEFLSTLNSNYKLAGIPNEVAVKMTGNTEEFVARVTPYPDVDHYLEEGEKMQIGNGEYEVIFTPGHSDGLVCFYNREQNILLSTDHILPKITPNISYWFHGDPNPLASYLQALEKVKKLDADLVVPSHGKPFYGANDRIDEIEKHHEDRLTVALDAIKNGASIYQACQTLFRKKLNIHETRFAIGETLAHLEYLRYAGECQREMRNGAYWYYVL